MRFTDYILPCFILFAFITAFIKKVDLYQAFTAGINTVIPLLTSIFPYIATILIMSELMQASGLTDILTNLLSPIFNFLGIPKQLARLVLLKPFSGSGSMALLADIFEKYGPDHYISRCGACIYGSSETIFYISAVYFSECKNKRLKKPVLISLISTFISCIAACLLCKIM